jgi:hypothetical protein
MLSGTGDSTTDAATAANMLGDGAGLRWQLASLTLGREPTHGGRGGTVTRMLLLGLGLTVANAQGVALLDILIWELTASTPVLGSVLVQAYFVDVVAASPTGRHELIIAWKRRR